MAELMEAVRTKSPPGRSWLLGRGGAALRVRPATRLVGMDSRASKTIGQGSSQPCPRGSILPVGAIVTDEFATRLGRWLADVAMNREGAA